MPRRADIDPGEIPRLLPDLMLVDLLPDGRYRCRLIGTANADAHGINATGRYLDEVLPGPEYRGHVIGLYDESVRARRPLYSESLFISPRGRVTERHTKVLFCRSRKTARRSTWSWSCRSSSMLTRPRVTRTSSRGVPLQGNRARTAVVTPSPSMVPHRGAIEGEGFCTVLDYCAAVSSAGAAGAGSSAAAMSSSTRSAQMKFERVARRLGDVLVILAVARRQDDRLMPGACAARPSP